jgi:RNA polymerase-binding transcription factor DksA
LKKELSNTGKSDLVAWRQNDADKKVKIEELISLLYACNYYISENVSLAYSQRAKTLGFYRNSNIDKFRSHTNIVADLLSLFEYINIFIAKEYYESNSLSRLTQKKRRNIEKLFLDIDAESTVRFTRSVSIVIFSALRCFLVKRENDVITFDRDVKEIYKLLSDSTPELFDTINKLSALTEISGDPGAFGKNNNTWVEVGNCIADIRQLHPSGGLPPYREIVDSEDDSVATGDIFVSELIDQWRLEMGELEDQKNELISLLNDPFSEKASEASIEIDKMKQTLLAYKKSINYAEGDAFGNCDKCGNSVPESRLMDALHATSCGC